MHSGRLGKYRLASLVIGIGVSAAQPPAARVDFVKQVQPVFEKSCYACHGAKLQMAGLRLDTKAGAMAKVVVGGKSGDSVLYQRIAGIGGLARMPMGGKLEPAEIDAIRAWIDQGAEW